MTSFTEARSRLNKQYGGAAAEKQSFIPRGAALQKPSAGGASGGSRFSGIRERLERQYNRRSDTVRRNSNAGAGSIIGYHGKDKSGAASSSYPQRQGKPFDTLNTVTAADYETQISGLDSEIQALEAVLEEANGIQSRIAQLSRNPYGWKEANNPMSEAYSQLQAVLGEYQDMNALKSAISEKKASRNRAKYIQEGLILAGAADNADFGEYSGYVSTEKDNWWGKLWSQYNMGYEDLAYEYINNRDGIREEIQKWDRFYGGVKKAPDYGFEARGYGHLNENEVALYNYYYAKEGKKKAQEYLDSIQEQLNRRMAEEKFGELQGKTGKELLYGVEAGLDQFESGVKNLFNFKDDYIPYSTAQITSQMVREDLADDSIPFWYNFKEKQWEDTVLGNSLGQVGYDLINTTSNMAPSILTSAVIGMVNPTAGAVVGNILMSGSAAGNAYQEAVNQGYDKGQARVYSSLIGGAEGAMQYVLGGIGKLGGKLSTKGLTAMLDGVDKALLRVAGKLGVNMASEGLEEGVQEILTPLLKNWVLRTDEDVNWEEAAYSALLGALSGGVLEGYDTVKGDIRTTQTGKQLQNAGITAQEIADIGKTFSTDTGAYQMASKLNENTNAYSLGRAFEEMGAELFRQNKKDIALGRDVTANQRTQRYQEVQAALKKQNGKNVIKADPEGSAQKAQITEHNSGLDGYIQALEKAGMLPERAGSAAIGGAEGKPEQDAKADEYYLNHSERQKNTTENGSIKYSLRTFEDNTRFVDVQMDTNIFDGLSVSEMNRKAKAILMDKFAGKVIGIDNKVFVNGDSVNEYLHPSKSIDLNVRKAKLAAAGELDNLLDAGKQLPNEPDGRDGHIHPDAIDFSYYKTIFKVGSEFFEGVVNVKNIKRGKLLKDVTKIRNITEDIVSSYGQNPKSNFLRDASMDSIRSIDKKVKSNAPEKSSVAPQQLSAFRRYAEEAGVQLEAVQETALQTMEKLSAVLGVKFYIYQSYEKDGNRYYVDENGRETLAPNGKYYANGRIYVDLNAGDGGKGTMLYTVSHELTHFIRQWSKAKYEVLADFLVEQYGRAGLRADNLVVEQMAKARRNGRKLSWEEAYEEMVADSMEAMLTDGNVVRTMAELKRQDKTLWQKICRWFQNLAEDLKAVVEAYKGHKPDSAEGQMVAGMRDVIGKLESLYADALMDAGENFQAASDGQKSAAQESSAAKYQARPSTKDPSLFDPRTVTRNDVTEMFENVRNGKYQEKTYIPVRTSTPGIVQERLFAKDLPIIMPVSKVAQALDKDNGPIKGKNVRGHGLSIDDLITIVERMDSPDFVYSQDNGRGVEVIKLGNNADSTVVIVEFDNNVNPAYMNGYEGGTYNVSVTMFDVDGGNVGLHMYGQAKGWQEVFNKQKEGDPARKFPATRPFAVEQDSLNENLAQSAVEVKEKLSDQDSGIKAKAVKGFAEPVQKYLGSRDAEEALANAQDRLLSAEDVAGWTGADWSRFFGELSRKKGKMAARETLKELASQGRIPKEMLIHASAGTRSGNMAQNATAIQSGSMKAARPQQTAVVADAESYARRLQEVMPELAAENADAGWRRGQKEVTKQEIHNGLEKSGQYDKIAAEIRSVGGFAENAKVHIPSQKIVLSELSFDDYHINEQRKHNVTREMAEKWIQESIASVTVWNGMYERYYGVEGAVYVDLQQGKIRTAFSAEEFDEKTMKLLEVFRKYGY